jgi:hypothetical protein
MRGALSLRYAEIEIVDAGKLAAFAQTGIALDGDVLRDG